ncbi:MAG TPA: glycosyltransferase family 9 protein [Pyrinomonadaceae bacterium]
MSKVARRLSWESGEGLRQKRHRALAYGSYLSHRRQLKRLRREITAGRKLIVVSLLDRMGDIVAAEPVSRYVRQRSPQAHILWCVREPYRELIDANPHIDETLPALCMTEWGHLARSGLFDEIIDLHIQGRICSTCAQPLVKTSGSPHVNFDNYYHLGNLLNVFCQAAGIPVIDDAPRVYIPQGAASTVDALRLPERFITVHAQSFESGRDWPAAKWRELVQRVSANWKLPVVEIGIHPTIKLPAPHLIDLCGKLSIMETAEVIKRSSAFVGIDSGPAHLGNALGTPGVILLGRFHLFDRYTPYSGAYADGSGARLIYSAGAASEIPVEQVYEALREQLKLTQV